MKDLLYIVIGVGLRDGFNPCIFMTSAVFIVIKSVIPTLDKNQPKADPPLADMRGQPAAGIHNPSWITWQRIIFVLVYASGFLTFNFGPPQIFLFQKNFVFAAKILYFILGVWAFILGILFFKDWFLMRRGLPVQSCVIARNASQRSVFQRRSNLLGGPAVLLITVILSLVLSALATLWPINNYIMILGNETILRGQWPMVMPLLAGYVFFSMWPLWFVWVFLSIKNLRPSLLKILCASVFFTASSSVIFIFKGIP